MSVKRYFATISKKLFVNEGGLKIITAYNDSVSGSSIARKNVKSSISVWRWIAWNAFIDWIRYALKYDTNKLGLVKFEKLISGFDYIK